MYQLFGLFLLLSIAAVVVSGCNESVATTAPSQSYYHVATARIAQRHSAYTVTREFAGTVEARQSAELGFELSGKLAELFVDEGERVAVGAVLARLDTELLEIAGAELRAQIQETEANLTLVQANLKRLQALRGKGFASAQGIDELIAQKQALRAGLDRQHAALRANEVRIRKATLQAPFAGVVSRRFVDQGVVVNPGAPVLRLLQGGDMEARIGLPERLLAQLENGGEFNVRVDGLTLPGRVIAIGSDVNARTRTVPVRLALPESVRLVDGALAYLQLEETVEGAGFWVPMTALTDGLRGLWNVYTLQPTAEPTLYRIESRDVQISYAEADRAFVTGALANGELIVGAGIHRLAPGQLVRRAE